MGTEVDAGLVVLFLRLRERGEAAADKGAQRCIAAAGHAVSQGTQNIQEVLFVDFVQSIEVYRLSIFRRATVIVVLLTIDRAEPFLLQQSSGIGNHGAVPAEIDGKILDRRDPPFNQPQNPT